MLNDGSEYNQIIFEPNLENVSQLDKVSLQYALCKFLAEVTKVKDGTDYPGKTLYEMLLSIHKYLNENSLNWKLIDDPEFVTLRTVLDNIIKERAESNIGMIKRQAEVLPLQIENDLWQQNVLGKDAPDKLRSIVLFLIGINCGLHPGA